MVIKVLLIAGLLGALLLFTRRRGAMRFQAGKKLLFAGFLLFSAVAVVQPELTTEVANAVGVGRGTDLLLYLLVLAFLFVAVSVYVAFKDVEVKMTRLARRVAIAEAEVRLRDEAR